MQGFSPIITTASPKNSALLKALGATHVLDRALSPDALRAALPATPITYVYDAFGRGRDAQRLGYSVLAPGGAFVSVIPFDDGALTDLVEESEGKREGERIARTRASYTFPGNGELGVEIFKRLTGWLESGVIVVRSSRITLRCKVGADCAVCSGAGWRSSRAGSRGSRRGARG